MHTNQRWYECFSLFDFKIIENIIRIKFPFQLKLFAAFMYLCFVFMAVLWTGVRVVFASLKNVMCWCCLCIFMCVTVRGQNSNPACFPKELMVSKRTWYGVASRVYFSLEIFCKLTYHVLFVSVSGALHCPV